MPATIRVTEGKPAPAPAPAAAKAVDVATVLADFTVSTAREAFTFAPNAKRAPVPAAGADAYVQRGARVSDSAPMLVLKGAGKPVALPLSAIGAAIAGGVIKRAEIAALLGES